MRPPDFILIGAMKCATSTLHEQLAAQRAVFMTTPKEPCFFSDDDVYARGIEWYDSLFADAPAGSLRGESSTHYTKLPTYPETISRVKRHLGDHTRFVYVMRHPIDRLISQYVHEWTQRTITCGIEEAIDRHPALIDYSRYGMQMAPWLGAFGPDCLLPVFFERLRGDPQRQLRRVCAFIGVESDPQWRDSISDRNVSSERLRKSPLRDAVVNFPILATLRRRLVPQAVRDRVKAIWRMPEKPRLSPDTVTRLTDIFDDDLTSIREWTGLDLTCANWKAVLTDGSAGPTMERAA